MTVISVTPDAADLIVGEDSFNEPPADGHQFFLATVRLTYIGETSDEFYVSDLNAVGQSAVGYNQFDDYAARFRTSFRRASSSRAEPSKAMSAGRWQPRTRIRSCSMTTMGRARIGSISR